MSTRHRPDALLPGLRDERGSAAMIAAIGMVLLLTIVASFVSLGQMETKIGVNRAQEVRAIEAAEGGAHRMFREIADSSNTAQQWIDHAQPIYSGVALGYGGTASYSVTIVDNSGGSTDADGIVAVKATGTAGGAARTVTLLVSQTSYPNDAIRMNGYLNLSGSPIVQGACGRVHIADVVGDSHSIDISVPGSPIVSQGVETSGGSGSVSGDYYKSTSPLPSPAPAQVSATTGVAPKPVPPIDPTKYAKYADYLLNSDGIAYGYATGAADAGTFCTSKTSACGTPSGWTRLYKDGSTTVLNSPGDCVKGWQWDQSAASNRPARWKDCGTSFVDGTFYVKGALTVTHNYSTSTHTTLITEASINFSGSPQFTGDTGQGPNTTIPKDILFVAGTDIKINSQLSNLYGVIAAHEQIELDNVGTMTGMLLAQNACDGTNNWPTCDGLITQDTINNSPHITYDCNMQPAELGTPASITKWLGT